MSALFEDATLTDLLIQQDQATIYATALQIAQTLGLDTTSWQPGDPTRSLYYLESVILEALEVVAVGYIGSGFLDYATGQWLTICAKQFFNVDVPAATFATTQVTLTNTLGEFFDLAPGDVIVKNSTTGATYTSTTGGNLDGSGGTLTITVVADQAGSASSASVGEIDTLVTTLTGVTVTNPTAAVGTDVQSPATTIAQCRNKAASFSPNGPPAAYEFVALNPTLTGVQTITRARSYPDSETGDVLLYVAGASGAVGSPDVAAVQAAVTTWCTPLCITPTVASASNVVFNVTYAIWLYQSVGQTTTQIQSAIQAALAAWFLARPIGGDILPPATIGSIYQSLIAAVIGQVFPQQTVRVQLSLPLVDIGLGASHVATLGVVTGTVTLIPGP